MIQDEVKNLNEYLIPIQLHWNALKVHRGNSNPSSPSLPPPSHLDPTKMIIKDQLREMYIGEVDHLTEVVGHHSGGQGVQSFLAGLIRAGWGRQDLLSASETAVIDQLERH